MNRVLRGAILAAAWLVPAGGWARAPVPLLHGIGVEETLDGPSVLATAWPASPASQSVPIVVHLVFQGAGSPATLDRLDARVAMYRARHIPVVLVLGAFPQSDAAIAAWRQLVRSIVERERGKISAYQFGAVAPAGAPLPGPYAFLLKQASIQIRSVDSDAQIVQGPVRAPDTDWLTRVYAEGVAPYVDALAIDEPPAPGAASTIQGLAAVVGREDPTASMWLGPVTLPDQPAPATERLIETVLRGLGTKVDLTIVRAGPVPLRAALTAASRIGDLLAGDMVALDAPVRWFRGGTEITTSVPSRLLYSQASSNSYLVFGGVAAPAASEVEVDVSMQSPAVRDPVSGTIERLPLPPRAANTSRRLAVGLAGRPLVLDFNYGSSTRSSSTEVRKPSLPDIGEVIARHQQAQAAQDAALVNYLAHLRIAQHFHPTAADPAYDLVFENELFFDRTGVEWSQLSLSINGATWRGNPPSIPLLQPEKVLSLPLELRLNQDYQYRLDGIDSVDGREAYVVRFDSDRGLARAVPGHGLDRPGHVRPIEGGGRGDSRERRRLGE